MVLICRATSCINLLLVIPKFLAKAASGASGSTLGCVCSAKVMMY
jgi:hypothetical protein